MSLALDHFFILTDAYAPQADLVVALGLIEGSSNKHPGQGTANRRFYFQNTTLELLYVQDVDEALNGPAKGLRLLDRSSNIGASPFGLVMRTPARGAKLPFDGWQYCPDYFANDQCFHVGSNSDILEEPLCIVMPNNIPQRKTQATPENLDWTLTELRLSVPVAELSNPMAEISKCQNITMELNKPHCMELAFNGGAKGLHHDFTPDMPLIINW